MIILIIVLVMIILIIVLVMIIVIIVLVMIILIFRWNAMITTKSLKRTCRTLVFISR